MRCAYSMPARKRRQSGSVGGFGAKATVANISAELAKMLARPIPGIKRILRRKDGPDVARPPSAATEARPSDELRAIFGNSAAERTQAGGNSGVRCKMDDLPRDARATSSPGAARYAGRVERSVDCPATSEQPEVVAPDQSAPVRLRHERQFQGRTPESDPWPRTVTRREWQLQVRSRANRRRSAICSPRLQQKHSGTPGNEHSCAD